MKKKPKELSESLAQNQDALEEILGDIKEVVSEETETRFKVQAEQKIVKLKKSDLVNCKNKNSTGSEDTFINKMDLEAQIRKIVRQEIRKQKENSDGKQKDNKLKALSGKEKPNQLSEMTKAKLEEIGRERGIELDRRKTKASLIKELEAKGIK